jgi:hypothetical protein
MKKRAKAKPKLLYEKNGIRVFDYLPGPSLWDSPAFKEKMKQDEEFLKKAGLPNLDQLLKP